ncbi:LicD family protein [Anaerocolumna sp. AGMB13020]|uniref:LicD family protein n=1 Tax=Anaerocolumna sp. AGMB13020 TaxID=3081750 RepID=UPI002955ADB5|nr:LicD family protein [Anaerocolumna sp. AGMB13020]WOO35161.1 LicD family protein [Anaerocolumna sp. AGMB13020]
MSVMEMDTESLRRMQFIELELLIEIDRICRLNEIKYNICGGTLIGAVRHKGFIPWDDDIDIRMLRSEYIKFTKACEKNLDSNLFFLQNFSSDLKYRWGYAKILKKDTIYIRTGQEHLGIKNGVYIDIFVSDGIPQNNILRKIHNCICYAVRKILWSPVGAKLSGNKKLRIWYKLLSLIPRSVPICVINLLARLFNEKNCEEFRALTFPQKRGLKKNWFTELTELEFEGHNFYAPSDYNGWLTQEYGDYMELPPPEKRISHSTASYYKF